MRVGEPFAQSVAALCNDRERRQSLGQFLDAGRVREGAGEGYDAAIDLSGGDGIESVQ